MDEDREQISNERLLELVETAIACRDPEWKTLLPWLEWLRTCVAKQSSRWISCAGVGVKRR